MCSLRHGEETHNNTQTENKINIRTNNTLTFNKIKKNTYNKIWDDDGDEGDDRHRHGLPSEGVREVGIIATETAFSTR